MIHYVEWDGTRNGNPNVTANAQCVTLSNRFQYHSKCATVPYYYWSLEKCDTLAATMCKTKPRDIGYIHLSQLYIDYTGQNNDDGLMIQ